MSRKFLLSFILFISFISIGQNSKKKIVSMTIVTKRINCMSSGTDATIGFATGYGSLSKIESKSVSNAKSKLSNYVDLRTYSNFRKDGLYKGNYSVVIKTKGKGPGCTLARFGIGYGMNEKEALEDAIFLASIRNPYWKKSKGYEMVSSLKIE